MSIEILKSTNVSALKIQTEGFVFNYPNLENALKKLIKNG
jgi:NAD dependent epimerase/dehydratase family enzyme